MTSDRPSTHKVYEKHNKLLIAKENYSAATGSILLACKAWYIDRLVDQILEHMKAQAEIQGRPRSADLNKGHVRSVFNYELLAADLDEVLGKIFPKGGRVRGGVLSAWRRKQCADLLLEGVLHVHRSVAENRGHV